MMSRGSTYYLSLLLLPRNMSHERNEENRNPMGFLIIILVSSLETHWFPSLPMTFHVMP